jgi:3-hydroxyisobutyrate dehydrogenase-like beta-hydroxyacid dehydrogenase
MGHRQAALVNVGFIGLGRMGTGMAGRILSGGHDLVVFNRTPGKAGDLVAGGAREVRSLAEVCAGREVVFTMVADDAALLEVVRAEDGLCASLPVGAIHVVSGTHGVQAVEQAATEHEAAGQILLAGHVLGRPDMAASGQLGVVAAGAADAQRRCAPLFDLIGNRTFDGGERPGGGTAIKLANNFALGCAIEVMAEAFSLVRAYGVDPAVMHSVLTEGLFSAPAYKVYGQIMVDEDWDRVGFTTRLALKDVGLMIAAAAAEGVPLPSAELYRERLLGAIEHGDAERDWAVLALEQARASGLA